MQRRAFSCSKTCKFLREGDFFVQIFKNRPLALLCCVTSVTAVLAKDLEGALKSWLLLLLLAATLLLFLGYRIGRSCKKLLHYGVFAVLGCSLALFSSYLYFDVYLPKTEEGIGDGHQLEGYVLEREQGSTFSSNWCTSPIPSSVFGR